MRRFLSNRGSGTIAFIFVAAAATYYAVNNISTITNMLSRQKGKYNVQYVKEKFTQGVFNYSVYAIKERWCMDKNWARDFECGDGMKGIVLNPLNLERLLWSKVAIDAIRDSYKEAYGTNIPKDPSLSSVKVTIPIDELQTLGISHPINLSLEPRLKRCLSELSIEVSKNLTTSTLPKGDESLLSIKIKATKNKENGCDFVEKDLTLDSEVGFYPRTLNQFSLIKSGDLKINDFKGSKGSYGVRFNGKVYVENDIRIPEGGFSPVAFYDSVKIGRGDIYRGDELFRPKTSGGLNDQFYTQLSSFYGFYNGVSLEGEVDNGISLLFDKNFKYPENSMMNLCITRTKLKDNPFLTKDSRLFIRGSSGSYTLGLSGKNEFREYKYFGKGSGTKYVRSWSDSAMFASKQMSATYTSVSDGDVPVMQVIVEVDGFAPLNVLLGRQNEVEVNINDTGTFGVLDQSQNDKFSFLDITRVSASAITNYSDLLTTYTSLKVACDKLLSSGYGVTNKSCKVVYPIYNETASECTASSDPADCQSISSSIESSYTSFDSARTSAHSQVKSSSTDPAKLVIKTNDVLSNKVGLSLKIEDKSKLKSVLDPSSENIKIKFVAFDFAVEGSSNPSSGKRTEVSHLPGPNEMGNSNIINIHLDRDSKTGDVGTIEYRVTNKDRTISQEVSKKGVSGWTVFKQDMAGEPPVVSVDGRKKKIYPEDEMSTSEAKKTDELCRNIENVSSAEWDISFTDNTQFSWLVNVAHSGIAITDPASVKPLDELIFTNDIMGPGNYKGVPNRSIVNKCIVRPEIDLVFGFYVCKELEILSRTERLNIIGTIITKKIKIPSGATKAGVNFYSIWHPRAVQILKDTGHLRKADGSKCDFSEPGWSPFLSENVQKDLELCSPMRFIYEGVNNFNWTTVDPEIGIPSDGSSVTTRSKIPNRYRRYTSKIMWVNTKY